MTKLRFTGSTAPGLGRALTTYGVVSAFWSFIFPQPYLAVIVLNALAPLIALGVLICRPGKYFMADGEAEGRNWNLAGLWILPMIAVGWRAIEDIQYIHTSQPVLIAALAGGVVAGLAPGWTGVRAAGCWRPC